VIIGAEVVIDHKDIMPTKQNFTVSVAPMMDWRDYLMISMT